MSNKKLLTDDEVDKLLKEMKIDWWDENTEPFPISIRITCECGSDKVGSPRHSSWCPKFTN